MCGLLLGRTMSRSTIGLKRLSFMMAGFGMVALSSYPKVEWSTRSETNLYMLKLRTLSASFSLLATMTVCRVTPYSPSHPRITSPRMISPLHRVTVPSLESSVSTGAFRWTSAPAATAVLYNSHRRSLNFRSNSSQVRGNTVGHVHVPWQTRIRLASRV